MRTVIRVVVVVDDRIQCSALPVKEGEFLEEGEATLEGGGGGEAKEEQSDKRIRMTNLDYVGGRKGVKSIVGERDEIVYEGL